MQIEAAPYQKIPQKKERVHKLSNTYLCNAHFMDLEAKLKKIVEPLRSADIQLQEREDKSTVC
jgi:hypothetical protein